jgi:hypothetical protein
MTPVTRWLSLACAIGIWACSPATDRAGGTAQNERPEAEVSDEHVFGGADVDGKFEHVDGYAQSQVIPVDAGATRAGFLIDALEGLDTEAIDVEVRGFLPDGTPTEWLGTEETFHEGPHRVSRADFPALVTATQIRVRIEQASSIAQLTHAAVIPEEPDAAGDDQPIESTQSALSADLSGLVQPRSAWNARATKCSAKDAGKKRMAIHHTETPTSSSAGFGARLRSIQAYHMDTRGWCDVGYHFLITENGQIWEGRPLPYIGAHVSNNNTGNIGISWVGCFHPGSCASMSTSDEPPQSMLDAGAALIGKLGKSHGIAINGTNVKPHRGHSGASTTCPGDNLAARIPDMLAAAGSGGSAPPPPPPPPPSSDKGRVVGVVWDLSTGSSPSASAKRVTTATVSADGGSAVAVRATDAYWELELYPGQHTIAASAPGYTASNKVVQVAALATTWASIGVSPGGSSSPSPSFGKTENSWSCGGTAGTYKNAAGKYYVTSFGCWVDSSGTAHSDSGDNCIPWCLGNASSQGRKAQYDALCAGMSGPDCERHVNWYTAGADRFGCGAKLKVKNPANGKAAVVAVLDRGPACWVEDKVDHWVLDLSYPASYHLFGEPKAATEKGLVVIEEVADSTPVGPL